MSSSVGGMRGPAGPLLRIVKDQRLAFLLAGGANTLLGLGWFWLFDVTVGRTAGYMVTLLLAHISSVLCAFVIYRRLVFRVRGHVLVDLARFESVYLVAIGVNAVALPVLVQFGHFSPFGAQCLIVVVTTLISYFGHRYFSFRRRSVPGGAGSDAGHGDRGQET